MSQASDRYSRQVLFEGIGTSGQARLESATAAVVGLGALGTVSADYLTRAVRRLLRVSGAEEFSMLGYCIGATLAVTYAGLYPQAPIRNLILLTAPSQLA